MAIDNVVIGVLALQGAFIEHVHVMKRLSLPPVVVEVRTAVDLATIDALLIPGGESTTMALIAERSGFLQPLRDWVASGRPVWVRASVPAYAHRAHRTTTLTGRGLSARSGELRTGHVRGAHPHRQGGPSHQGRRPDAVGRARRQGQPQLLWLPGARSYPGVAGKGMR